MKKEVTLKTIADLTKIITSDKLLHLEISTVEGVLMCDYHVSEKELDTKTKMLVKLLKPLKDLFNAIILDKVNTFDMLYDYEKETLIVNHEFSYDNSIDDDQEKISIFKECLEKAVVLANDLSMEGINAGPLYEKRGMGNSRKTKYISVSIVRALQIIQETFEQ